MKNLLKPIAALVALVLLSACAAPSPKSTTPGTLPGYEGVQDGNFFIPQVNENHLRDGVPRKQVGYAGDERPGSIVIDPYVRKLYYVLDDGQAMQYSIAVGRAGLGFKGSAVVRRKEEWPAWTPTANMVRTMPEMYAEYSGGLPGGLENPLGARALYLYRNGRDTYYRIHGTVDNQSIGRATSAGCIRLFNQDAIDLYDRTEMGTVVRVRTRDESEQLEGKWMDDEYGFLVPYDESLIPVIEQRKLELEAKDAAEAEAAAELEATRTSAQRDAELEGTQG